jgi:hypothetical protein
MAQAVGRRPLTTEAQVRARVSSWGISGGQSVKGTGLSQLFAFSCQYHSTVAFHTHMSPGGWTIGPSVSAVQASSHHIDMNINVVVWSTHVTSWRDDYEWWVKRMDTVSHILENEMRKTTTLLRTDKVKLRTGDLSNTLRHPLGCDDRFQRQAQTFYIRMRGTDEKCAKSRVYTIQVDSRE